MADRSRLSLLIAALAGLAWLLAAAAEPLAADPPENAAASDVVSDPASDAAPVPKRVAELDQRIAELNAEEARLREEIRQIRARSTDADRVWQGLLGRIDQIEREQKSLQDKVVAQRKAAEEAEAKRVEALAMAEEARKRIEEAQRMLAAAEQAAAESEKAAKEAIQPIADMQARLEKLPSQLEPLPAEAAVAEQAALQLRTEIQRLEADAAGFPPDRRKLRGEVEQLLRQSGDWISFASDIAPILHSHCVACHNVRNPQGRYNLATYDAALALGESGEAILPGNADDSYLVQLIEDGSMPLEADPLTPDQITLIRRWIDAGARLDLDADPAAPLIRLMPRLTQPDPPATYRAPLPVTAIAVDPNSGRIATSGYHEVLVWSADDSEPPLRITNVAQRVYGLAFHPDGRRLAVAAGTPGRLGELKLFDTVDGTLLDDRLVSEDVIFDVAFSPDASRLAACGADGSITIFQVDDPNTLPLRIEDHADWVHAIAWAPNGKLLASASRDKTAKLFDAETGRLRWTFSNHNHSVTAVTFVENGSQVATGGNDRKVRIWKVDDGKQVRDIGGFAEEISGLVLIDDQRLATVAADQRLRLHAVADGKGIQQIDLPNDWSTVLTLSPDRRALYIGNQDGQVIELTVDPQQAKPLRQHRVWTAAPATPRPPVNADQDSQ